MEKIILSAPVRITAGHDLASFQCGVPVLDHWLRGRALQNEASGASRTYVMCTGRGVAGYYALAAGSVLRAQAPGFLRRNMPDKIPVILLGRLAIDQAWQGKGIGRALLRDAVLRTYHVAQITGVRALMAHAISDSAQRFYKNAGFHESPVDPLILMLTLDAIGSELKA